MKKSQHTPPPIDNTAPVQPIAADAHLLAHDCISPHALSVLRTLQSASFAGFLVGGCVRDLLLGRTPKDFDLVTDAHPEQVRRLFHNCRLIGRRFRLAHVYFDTEIIEVATFRAGETQTIADTTVSHRHLRSDKGMILRDNVYGNHEDDAWRRDFTINALYYDGTHANIVDYTGGLADLKAGLVRMIGDPSTRYLEDPVRLLRAVRFASKLNFTIHPDTAKPITKLAPLLLDVSPARRFDEFLKLFLGGAAEKTFAQLDQYALLPCLMPATMHCLSQEKNQPFATIVQLALKNTDSRIENDRPVTPAFLLAVLLWQPLLNTLAQQNRGRLSPRALRQKAMDTVFRKQAKYTSIPKRFSHMARDIWELQWLLPVMKKKRIRQNFSHVRFRAAYDFLLLRADAGDRRAKATAAWWTTFQDNDDAARLQQIDRAVAAARK